MHTPCSLQLEGRNEYCLEDVCKESEELTEKVWALIDIDKQVAYGIKVCW